MDRSNLSSKIEDPCIEGDQAVEKCSSFLGDALRVYRIATDLGFDRGGDLQCGR